MRGWVALWVLFFAGSAGAGEFSLRIMTFDTALLRLPGYGDVVPKVDERAQLIPDALVWAIARYDLDVVVLQQVWEGEHARAIQNALTPLQFEIFRPSKGGKPLGHGLLVAIRGLRVAETRFVEFTKKAGLEHLTGKGFLALKVEGRAYEAGGSGVAFWLVGTHLQNLRVADGNAIMPSEREAHAAQIAQIAGFVEQEWSRGIPVIIAGSTTSGPGYAEASYRVWRDHGFEDLCAEQRLLDPLLTYSKGNPLAKTGLAASVDHFFGRPGAEVTLKSRWAEVALDPPLAVLSSHYGLVAEIVAAGPGIQSHQ